MAAIYLAIFDPEEFEGTRRLLGPDMTDTNAEWAKLISDRSHQIEWDGDEPITVKIHPDELAIILATHGDHGVLNALDLIADIKGSVGQRDYVCAAALYPTRAEASRRCA